MIESVQTSFYCMLDGERVGLARLEMHMRKSQSIINVVMNENYEIIIIIIMSGTDTIYLSERNVTLAKELTL